MTDALGNETRYAYDAMGRLVKVERFGEAQGVTLSGNKTEIQTTAYEWNQRGLVTGIINPLGEKETFAYDAAGRMTDKWDRDGYHTSYGYDNRGLLKEILYADGTGVEYSYDALRRLKEVKDSIGTTGIVTDALGRVLSVTDPQGRAVGYEWGSMNEKQRLVYPDGKEASYHYNDKGQLDALTTAKGTIRYAYDTMGRLTEKTFSNGVTTKYSYDRTGHLEKINHSGNGFAEEYGYRYDMAGNKIEACKQRQGVDEDNGSFRYGYDALNRLTEVSRDGRLLRRYAYDAFGNRTVKEDYSGQTAVRTTYRYNVGNQMVSRVDEEGEQSYAYDRRGNLTAVSRGEEQLRAFTFDAANRMRSAYEIKDGTGKRAEYTYNAFGNRIGQDVYGFEADKGIPEAAGQKPQNPEQQITYILDLTRQYHNLLVSEDKAEQKEQTFYWDGNVAAVTTNAVKAGSINSAAKTVNVAKADSAIWEEWMECYYLQDDLGSPMQLLDEEGEIRESYGFDEFGLDLCSLPEPQIQPFGYTGYQKEAAGGLYFAQARRYDAGNGRFVSKDQDRYLRFYSTNTLNQYIYCVNNPIIYTDPKGNDLEDDYIIEVDEDDAVQVTISGNTITIDAYVDITGDINTAVGNSIAHDLVIDGIEKWAGSYTNVYGYEVTVEVNVYEGHKSEWSWLPWVSNQNYVEIELFDSPGRAYAIYSQDYIAMYTGFNNGNARDDTDYFNTIAHEFGHILGVKDGYADASCSRPLATMLQANDIMVNNHDQSAYISDIDIQMLIMAASTNEPQYFMTYDKYIQSDSVK